MARARTQDLFQRLETFVREYTEGLSGRDLQRLFDRDAAQAYAVLTREHAREPEPEGRCKRFFHRARIAFLGLSYKLTPARRLLFALALIFFITGFLQEPKTVFEDRRGDGDEASTSRVVVDFSPLMFTLSFGSLIYLLALELVDRIRVRDELEVARELQRDLLPQEIATVPGYTFAHSYRTANEVGGDYYDITPLPDGRVALMVGDASGHGMAAGLVMAIANATLETALDLDPSPERVLELLNRTLCRTGTTRTFMSLFYAVLTPGTGHLEYVCAGHPFPLLRRTDGSTEELGCGALPLGMREALPVACQTVEMAPGDLLLLYTDGLAEAVDVQGGAFSYDRIRRVLELGGSPQAVHDMVLGAFDRHVGDEPLRDDLTLLVMARLPPLPG